MNQGVADPYQLNQLKTLQNKFAIKTHLNYFTILLIISTKNFRFSAGEFCKMLPGAWYFRIFGR